MTSSTNEFGLVPYNRIWTDEMVMAEILKITFCFAFGAITMPPCFSTARATCTI